MPLPESAIALWTLSILFSVLTVILISVEIHRFFFRGQDRGFWAGAWILCLIVLSGRCAQFGWDRVDKHAFSSVDHAVVWGVVGKSRLSELVPEVSNRACVMNDSPESARCIFFMNFMSADQSVIDYVSTDDKSYFRYGEWPFSRVIELPLIEF